MYTDGGCRDGFGGWAYVISKDGKTIVSKESGGEKETTNNKMELTAILRGLMNFDFGDEVEVYSDSQYALNMSFGNWKATTNFDLIEEIHTWKEGLSIKPVWVKGHAEIELNEICDQMCTDEIMKLKEEVCDEQL